MSTTSKTPRKCDVIRLAASQSFPEREVAFLEQLTRTIAAGGDVRVLARSPEFGTLYRKVIVMREAIERARVRRNERDGADGVLDAVTAFNDALAGKDGGR